jgi:hypothetical protein
VASDYGIRVEEHHFPGDRAAVTRAATEAALGMLTAELERFTNTGSRT